MKISIDQIIVDEDIRIRQEVGNLRQLEESISSVGLINPILVDEQYNLVAGYRRLMACKNLGYEDIEATIVEFGGDMLKMLDVEVAENFYRKDFTFEEILAIEKRRQEIIEASRKKGFFERTWLWMKNLFGPDQENSAGATVPEKKEKPDQTADDQGADEQAETSTDETNDTPSTDENAPFESKENEQTTTDNEHTIKWRTS